MEYFPAPLEKLVEQFARLPGIGSKSAQRLAFHVLNLPMEQAQEFANAIVEAKQKVTLCPICRNLTAGQVLYTPGLSEKITPTEGSGYEYVSILP